MGQFRIIRTIIIYEGRVFQDIGTCFFGYAQQRFFWKKIVCGSQKSSLLENFLIVNNNVNSLGRKILLLVSLLASFFEIFVKWRVKFYLNVVCNMFIQPVHRDIRGIHVCVIPFWIRHEKSYMMVRFYTNVCNKTQSNFSPLGWVSATLGEKLGYNLMQQTSLYTCLMFN